jgi:RNA polymerase sigma-70 factor (ECF subfamily)
MRLHSQFDAVREPRRWLYRTVHNLALNYHRKGDRIVSFNGGVHEETGEASAGADPADPLPLPDEQIARWEGIGLIRLTLESLDARSREVLRLKFNEELSYKEIGAKCGLTVGHVGYLLHHALKAMATELAKNGIVR